MSDKPDRGMEGFYLSEINTKRLLIYVTDQKLKGNKINRSMAVNQALDLLFEKEGVVVVDTGEVA